MTDRKVIGVGTAPNDFTGDSIRQAMTKANDNFEALWDEKSELVQRITGVTSALDVSAEDSGTIFTNTDAEAQIEAQLPIPARGVSVTFLNRNEFGWKIFANGGAKIRLADSLSTADGDIDTTTAGNGITLTCLTDSEWFAHPITGSGWAAH